MRGAKREGECDVEDVGIIQLYWDRDESAITESSGKYGAYCASIARNILHSPPDEEECVSDTWLKAWNAMPPHRPGVLSAFFGKITRNLSFDRYKSLHRQKRGGGQMEAVLDELAECVSGVSSTEQTWDEKELAAEINRFLQGLSEEKRALFILRYWSAASLADIAERTGMSENNVSVNLNRIRTKLKTHLIERGFDV